MWDKDRDRFVSGFGKCLKWGVTPLGRSQTELLLSNSSGEYRAPSENEDSSEERCEGERNKIVAKMKKLDNALEREKVRLH